MPLSRNYSSTFCLIQAIISRQIISRTYTTLTGRASGRSCKYLPWKYIHFIGDYKWMVRCCCSASSFIRLMDWCLLAVGIEFSRKLFPFRFVAQFSLSNNISHLQVVLKLSKYNSTYFTHSVHSKAYTCDGNKIICTSWIGFFISLLRQIA